MYDSFINKPINKSLWIELCRTAGITNPVDKDIPIYFGGPVLLERCIILHSADFKSEGTIRISDEFAITSQKTILKKLQNQSIILHKLILGHAGWSAGQLEREIENGDWLLQSSTQDFVFKIPADQMWRQAAGSIGMDLDTISSIGGQA